MKLIKNKRVIIYIIMASWIVLVSNYNKRYNPKKIELSNVELMNASLMKNISSLVNYKADIKNQERDVLALKRELQKINVEYEKLGALIPKKGNIDQFLKYLTHEEKSKNLLFRVINPVKDSSSRKDLDKGDGKPFFAGIETHVYELKIFGYYSDIYNYIKYLEKLSHFGGVIKTKITRDIKDKTDKLEALIWFSLIISNEEVKNQETTFNASSNKLFQKLESPFLTFKNTPETQAVIVGRALPSFDISGIISNKTENLVIINEQIYKAGDKIDQSIIVNIDTDKVVFKTDSIKHEVSIS